MTANPKPTPQMYDGHMHTPLCRHAIGEPEAYAETAVARNLKGITFTCHNPLPDGISQAVRMYEPQLPEYHNMVQRAADAFKGQLEIRIGLECDWLPGLEPFLHQQLTERDYSFIIGSVHCQIPEYLDIFYKDDVLDFQKTYFQNLANAAETGLFDCISHPDLIKNTTAKHWDLPRVMSDVCDALDRIAETGVAMELNTSGRLKRISEYNPGLEILSEMAKRQIKVVIGSDSHDPIRVADHFETAMDQLLAVGYKELTYFIDRQPYQLDILEARQSLTPLAQNAKA